VDSIEREDGISQRTDRLLATLERLLELPATRVTNTLNQAVQLVAEVLEADKVDAFFYDPSAETLVALGTSDTPMGRRQKAIGLDRLPMVNGGRTVEVFLTGTPYLTGHADQDPIELVGVTKGLGVISEMAVVFEVETQRRGVLLVSSGTPDFFTQQDLYFLQAVARWIGILIGRAEAVERMRYEAVDQGRRLAAEELLTIMAHDLRNYLTPLQGRIELLLRRAYREKRTQDIHDAGAAASTLRLLERIISDLLDVARLNQGIFAINPQPMNLVALVEEVVPTFRAPEVPIHVHAPSEIVLSADPNRLRQLLENLLANAVKHAPKKTPVEVKVDVEKREDGSWAVLRVSNQGPSIPTELLENLFHPFVADSQSTGLGFGLYLASKIAEAHAGTLTVDSSKDQGVHFTFALPIEEDVPDEGMPGNTNL
jgi:signal transduction histidine kinase